MISDADKRRQAFIRFLKTQNVTRGAVARRANIPPNIVYNFLKSRSTYLSQPALEKISQAFGVPISEIIGETAPSPPPQEFPVLSGVAERTHEYRSGPTSLALGPAMSKIIGTVMGLGVWTQSPFLAPERDELASISVPAIYAEKAFAVRIAGTTMDELFPGGAILGCVATQDYLQRLVPGDIVIMVRRNQIGLFEATVKQYVTERKKHFLISRSTDPRQHEEAELLAPLNDPTALGHQDFYIQAIVLHYSATLPASNR